MTTCEICPIVNEPSPDELERVIIEGEYWRAALRLDQEYLGTTFVTAKRHIPSLPEVTSKEDNEFIVIRNELITTQMRAFGAQVVNLACLMNLAFNSENGDGEGHVHYHLKPRYATTVSFAGEVFTDRQFGYYIKDKNPHVVSQETAIQIVGELRKHL